MPSAAKRSVVGSAPLPLVRGAVVAVMSLEGEDDDVLRYANHWARSDGRPLTVAAVVPPPSPVRPLLPHQAVFDAIGREALDACVATLTSRCARVLGRESEAPIVLLGPHVAPGADEANSGLRDLVALDRAFAPAVYVADALPRIASLLETPSRTSAVVRLGGQSRLRGPIVAVVRPGAVEVVVEAALLAADREGVPICFIADGVPHAELMDAKTVAVGRVPARDTAVAVSVEVLDGDSVTEVRAQAADLNASCLVVPWGDRYANDGVVARVLAEEARRPMILV